MSTVSITIKNLPQIKAAFHKSPTLMVKYLDKAIAKSLLTVKRQESLEYRTLGINVITGGLIDSIQRGTYQKSLYGEVGPNVTGSPGVDYAGYVHDGTRYMRSRPYLLEAVKDSRKDIEEFFTDAVDNVLSDIAGSI